MAITVLDVAVKPPVRDGGVEAAVFLDPETVGARTVEGTAYRLAPGATVEPLREPARYQVFYVTAGAPIAIYKGERYALAPGGGVYCDPSEACAFENPGPADAAFYRFVVAADEL